MRQVGEASSGNGSQFGDTPLRPLLPPGVSLQAKKQEDEQAVYRQAVAAVKNVSRLEQANVALQEGKDAAEAAASVKDAELVELRAQMAELLAEKEARREAEDPPGYGPALDTIMPIMAASSEEAAATAKAMGVIDTSMPTLDGVDGGGVELAAGEGGTAPSPEVEAWMAKHMIAVAERKTAEQALRAEQDDHEETKAQRMETVDDAISGLGFGWGGGGNGDPKRQKRNFTPQVTVDAITDGIDRLALGSETKTATTTTTAATVATVTIVVCSPTAAPIGFVGEEIKAIKESMTTTVTSGATPLEMSTAVRGKEVVHLMGHGDGTVEGRPVFVFADENGNCHALKPETLASMFGPPTLIMLAGCTTYDLGRRLCELGHTVVSWRTPVVSEIMPAFSGAFYAAYATADDAGAAFDAACIAVVGQTAEVGGRVEGGGGSVACGTAKWRWGHPDDGGVGIPFLHRPTGGALHRQTGGAQHRQIGGAHHLPPSPYVTGREKAKWSVIDALGGGMGGMGGMGGSSRVVALSGMGGVGKSALAVAVAHEIAGQFDDVFQVDAGDSAVDFQRSFRSMVEDQLDLHPNPGETWAWGTVVAKANKWLSGRNCLVLIDNADILSDIVLPRGCAVLLTSRRSEAEIKGWNDGTVVPVTCLPVAAAVEVLHHFGGGGGGSGGDGGGESGGGDGDDGGGGDVGGGDAGADAAQWLAGPEALDGLPLALRQIAAWVKRGYTWQEAREKYAALLKKRPGVWSQRDVVATTFDMHREHLSPNALKLLDVLSVTFPDRVPFELLDDVLGMETRELAMELADVCLVDTATETGVSIHRVTQLAVRGGLDEAGREGGRETLELNVARSCNEVGIRFMNDARYSDAETLLVHALGTCQRVDGETDHTATSIGNLAMLYTKQGRYKEAEAMYVEKLAMRRKTLPEDHPDIANSLGSLALLYMNQGRYDEAEPMYVKALAMSRKTLPEDHPSIARGINYLASVYHAQGRYEKAGGMMVEALAMQRKTLPEDHKDIANSLGNLAGLYYEQGRLEEAEEMYGEALAMRRKTLPEDHPDIATTLYNMAMLYMVQRRYKEAEAMYVEALAMRRRALPEDHPLIASSLNSLAGLYLGQGRYDEAEPMYVKALAMSRKTLPEDHPNVQTVRRSLADCRSRMASPGTETERVERHAQKKKLKKELARQKEAAATPTRQRSKSEDDRAAEAAERAMAELLEEEGGTCGGGGKKKKGGGRGGKGKKKGKKKRR